VIALDSNVLVRLLVEDDPVQTAAAVRLVERAAAEEGRLFLATVALCETVWVLRSAYGFPREEIAEVVLDLLAAQHLVVERRAEAERALAAFASGRGDLPDYLLREAGASAGAAPVATFDRPLLREAGFVHPDPEGWPEGVSLREAAPTYARRHRARA